jgi:hypothetical protein
MSAELIAGAVAGQQAANHGIESIGQTTPGESLWLRCRPLLPDLSPVEAARLRAFLRVVEKRLEGMHK